MIGDVNIPLLEFKDLCESVGLERQLAVAYMVTFHKKNGVAEKENTTIVELAKYMLHEKKFHVYGVKQLILQST